MIHEYNRPDRSIKEIVYGDWLRDMPMLRLLKLRKIQADLMRMFNIVPDDPNAGGSMELLALATFTASDKSIVDVMLEIIKQVSELEIKLKDKKHYGKNN